MLVGHNQYDGRDIGSSFRLSGRAYRQDHGEDSDPNPLARLPKRFQIIPAYYIVANLPVVIAQPAAQAQEGFQYAQMLTKRRYEVKAEHMELWERELRLLADEIGGRSSGTRRKIWSRISG